MRSNHLWDFLWAILVTTAATSAFGQAVTAPVRIASQSAVSIPDLSGTWVYPWCCGFGPPLSGPGPVLRRRPQFSPAGVLLPGAANAALASELARFVGDHTSSVLKPQAADVVKRHGEVELSGGGKALQLHFRVEDEGVFTMPWSATITYWRSFGEWPEHVCAESLRATYVWRESAIPRADKPDF
jgi:hypothetical protein